MADDGSQRMSARTYREAETSFCILAFLHFPRKATCSAEFGKYSNDVAATFRYCMFTHKKEEAGYSICNKTMGSHNSPYREIARLIAPPL